jgi:glycosyltransferase involved in cell wall biosynthesis
MEIIRNARGLINITKESFGICTMEALLCGVPVFGFNGGASVELVDSESGILVPDKEHETLVSNFRAFAEKQWDREKIQNRARNLMMK